MRDTGKIHCCSLTTPDMIYISAMCLEASHAGQSIARINMDFIAYLKCAAQDAASRDGPVTGQ